MEVPLLRIWPQERPVHSLVPVRHEGIRRRTPRWDVLCVRHGAVHARANGTTSLRKPPASSSAAQKKESILTGVNIGTDILVGFPGETDSDFEDIGKALWKSPLFYAHVFKYSEREGTASVRMADKVPGRVINERVARLRKLSADNTRMFCEHQTGEVHEVLFEQAQDGSRTGYTGNYTRVAVRSGEDLANEMRQVRLEEVRGDPVIGTLAQSSS